ncbi:sugar transferase [Microbacterium saperdae]|uniref:Lipopolysaccharide/colanic/teichoic acid biosynthesis glycosyltransferase n=1 Tax=Microbacterium saperdae TaxID=69368 RepID=A0A543BQQ6_9MICO|nr:sugar transferase [Microbacterium saperdae]TQL87142.1 lipopolysaccharide/colanic/teichoic acid biosynthesis glycosyltransferase [Microbacterium saperdae]
MDAEVSQRMPRPYDALKRALDIVTAAVGLVVLSPVILVTAIAVRVNLGSPVLFSQPRPGRNGRVFRLYKFRSMRNVDAARGWISDEQRLTRFGRVLRSTSLDELPSLWNVLRGDMSVVGPRPLLVEYLPRYSPEQARRHEVRPGITGLAQVNGRNTVDWEQRFALDVRYVDSRSLALDARILIGTVRSVVVREGISAEGHATMRKFGESDD